MQMKALRKKCGYTQKEAADKFGISLRTYISYENDESKSTSMKYRYMINELENLSHMDEEHGVLSVDEIRKICDDVFKNYDVKYCYLFGSYAKGKATQSSDVDLLIS
ncbi:MAG: helix-turn-helix domain-containing protein, partial [Lachnospiraceae bacterium]|nr:helix-turn-helix domain-containing protein [Lachnospiraceae bacterium]